MFNQKKGIKIMLKEKKEPNSLIPGYCENCKNQDGFNGLGKCSKNRADYILYNSYKVAIGCSNFKYSKDSKDSKEQFTLNDIKPIEGKIVYFKNSKNVYKYKIVKIDASKYMDDISLDYYIFANREGIKKDVLKIYSDYQILEMLNSEQIILC